MRGAGDQFTIGERIAFYRARRGYTQVQLANLVGRSSDWLSKIERGERQLRNVETLTHFARVLRVTLTDLVGQPTLLEDEQQTGHRVPTSQRGPYPATGLERAPGGAALGRGPPGVRRRRLAAV